MSVSQDSKQAIANPLIGGSEECAILTWEWVKRFEAKKGRRPRVLHIGNIANNAYNNAKIQRKRGIHADVLSFDYYHIVSCPEWEDGNFSGHYGDDFMPDWWAAKLDKQVRPKWFAQGPLDASIRYLLAHTNQSPSRHWLWLWLTFERWLLCNRSPKRDQWMERLHRWTGIEIKYVYSPANAAVSHWLAPKALAWSEKPLVRAFGLGGMLRRAARRLKHTARTANVQDDRARHMTAMKKRYPKVAQKAAECLASIGRSDVLEPPEGLYIYWQHPYLRLLFSKYDVIQCYATYAAMPLMAGWPEYLAYEHGTIRSIPFQLTDEGRLCLTSFRAAEAVMVTNTDNLEATEKMGIDPQRVIPLPHAFDSDKLLKFQHDNPPPYRARDGKVEFLTPTRQHWVDQDPGWAKGNDRVFRAIKRLKDDGLNFVLKAVEWGNDLEASKAMIRELGIEDRVMWVPVMRKKDLWTSYLACDAVIDQFLVAAFSGVTFESMILGKPVIAALNNDEMLAYFGSAPPVMNSVTEDDIYAAMKSIITDRTESQALGQRSQNWMKRYHSADRIVAMQTQCYASLVGTQDTLLAGKN